MKRKKLTASMIALVMSVSLPMTTYAANWYLEDGSVTVNADNSGQTVTQGSGSAVPDEAPVITQRGSSAETSNTITINASENATANVTISNVNIDTSGAAVSTGGKGNVNIELDGTNTLKSGVDHAGLEKSQDGKLTITDENANGKLIATGGDYGAGIGGDDQGNGKNITITGGTVNADGGTNAAGIGGGATGSGSNVTVSGAAQVTAIAGKSNGYYGAGATIGNGGDFTGSENVDGKEIQADISRVTTGYIHHIIYDPALVSEDNPLGIVREWWEPERPQPKPENPQPNPEDPNAPAEESNEVDLGTPLLHVETLEGDPLPFDARQQGSTLRVTTDNLAARLHGTRQALEALQEQGVEQIQFVTTLKTTTLPVEELLAEGGSWFALEHNGLVSRRLSAAQAESLKCWMR